MLMSGKGEHVVIVFEPEQNGTNRKNVYRGPAARRQPFDMYKDERKHEHEVRDAKTDELIYWRDWNGKVYVGTDRQLQAAAGKRAVGHTAVAGGLLADSTKRAVRWWFGQQKR